MPDLSFEPDVPDRITKDIVTKIRIGRDIRATSADDGLSYTLGRVRTSTAARLFEQLDFLNEWRDADRIMALVQLALAQLGVTDDIGQDDPVYIDPLRLSVALASQIRRRWRERPPSYEVIDGDRVLAVSDARVLVDQDIEAPVRPDQGVPAFRPRLPIGPWSRGAHEAYLFDTPNEFLAARILDQTDGVSLWLRNDPPSFVIPTPVGNFEPDFLYVRAKSGATSNGMLEIKGEFLYEAPEQKDPIKVRAACEWVQRANAGGADPRWEFAMVFDADVPSCVSLADLLFAAHVLAD